MPVRLLTRIGDTRDEMKWGNFNIEEDSGGGQVEPKETPTLLPHANFIQALQVLNPDIQDFYKQISAFKISENAPSSDDLLSNNNLITEIQETGEDINPYPIYAWIDPNSIDGNYTVLYYTEADEILIKYPAQFQDFNNAKQIYMSKFNFNFVTDLSHMFDGCSQMTYIATDNITGFDTSNCTNFSYMFNNCSSMVNLYCNMFNVSSCTDFSYMFNNCNKAKNIDISGSGWNTSNGINFSYMFSNCYLLEDLTCNAFNFSSATDISYMLQNINPVQYSEFGANNITFKIFENYVTPNQYVEVDNSAGLFRSTIDSQYFYTTTTDHVNYINPIIYGNFKSNTLENMYLFGTPANHNCIGPIIIGDFICTAESPTSTNASPFYGFDDSSLTCPPSYKNICIVNSAENGINIANKYVFNNIKISNSIIIGFISESSINIIHSNANTGMDPYLNKVSFINKLMEDNTTNVVNNIKTIFSSNIDVTGMFDSSVVGGFIYVPSFTDFVYAGTNIDIIGGQNPLTSIHFNITATDLVLTNNTAGIDPTIKLALCVYNYNSRYYGTINQMNINKLVTYDDAMYNFYDYTQDNSDTPCIRLELINGPYFCINTDFASDTENTLMVPGGKQLYISNASDSDTLISTMVYSFIETLNKIAFLTNNLQFTLIYEASSIGTGQDFDLYDTDTWTNPTIIPTSDSTYGCQNIIIGTTRQEYYGQ